MFRTARALLVVSLAFHGIAFAIGLNPAHAQASSTAPAAAAESKPRRAIAKHASDRPEAKVAPYTVVAAEQIWREDSRGREIPVRLRLPQQRRIQERFPVIVYSHGLSGDSGAGDVWSEHWAANGYIVVQILHPGSDESVWNLFANRVDALRSLRLTTISNQLVDRALDVRFVLDQLSIRPEFRNANLYRIGMSGHAFGALTTQALAGQKIRARGPDIADPRIHAALALSPTVRNRVDAETQFNDVTMPFMCVTGTQDAETFGFGISPQERTRPFYAMPPGNKYLVVLHGADHWVFAGRPFDPNDPAPRAPQAERFDEHVNRAVTAITLAFWDAHLKDNAQAKRWLAAQARRVLTVQDRFERR